MTGLLFCKHLRKEQNILALHIVREYISVLQWELVSNPHRHHHHQPVKIWTNDITILSPTSNEKVTYIDSYHRFITLKGSNPNDPATHTSFKGIISCWIPKKYSPTCTSLQFPLFNHPPRHSPTHTHSHTLFLFSSYFTLPNTFTYTVLHSWGGHEKRIDVLRMLLRFMAQTTQIGGNMWPTPWEENL